MFLGLLKEPHGQSNSGDETAQTDDQEDPGSPHGQSRTHRGYLTTVRASCKCLRSRIEDESLQAVAAGNAIVHGGAGADGFIWNSVQGRQIYDALAIGTRTGDPHRRCFAYEQAITWAANVFLQWRGIPDRGGLIAGTAFDNMLMKLPLDVDHRLTNSAADDGSSSVLVVRCVRGWVLVWGNVDDRVTVWNGVSARDAGIGAEQRRPFIVVVVGHHRSTINTKSVD